MSLKAGAKRLDFAEDRGGATSTVDTNVSDHSEYGGGLRASYDLSSLTSLFSEADINRRDHRQLIDANGFRRGSEGYGGAVGVKMSNRSKLSGELSAGYRVQMPDDPTLARIEGVTLDAGLDWQASALTRLSLEAGEVRRDDARRFCRLCRPQRRIRNRALVRPQDRFECGADL